MDLWTTGVSVVYGYAGEGRHGWSASLDWQSGKFAELGYMEGEIRTRYFEETLEKAVDCVVAMSERFGVGSVPGMGMFLYYEGDGENKDNPPPRGWKSMLAGEASRRDWQTYPPMEEEETA